MFGSIAPLELWIGFHVVVVIALLLDLVVLHKDGEAVSKKEAAIWSAVWITLSLAFGAGLWVWFGADAGVQFMSAYLVEKSLSVDNLFVFLLIFAYFKVPEGAKHRVLFWGVFGAIVMRALMIGLGVALIKQFEVVLLILAGVLIFSGVKLLFASEGEDDDLSKNRVVWFAKKLVKVTDEYNGSRFTVVVDGVKRFTPLVLVLIVVELSDIMFAVDSIPAVFGVATDPFLIYSSNICAILGLRALFFLLAGALAGLRFLSPCLGLVLSFVGVKMILGYFDIHMSSGVALGVVGGLLAAGVGLSLVFPGNKAPPEDDTNADAS